MVGARYFRGLTKDIKMQLVSVCHENAGVNVDLSGKIFKTQKFVKLFDLEENFLKKKNFMKKF